MSILYVPDDLRADIDAWREEPDAIDGADLLMEILRANGDGVVDDTYARRLSALADRIGRFSAECEEGEYTDTGEAWELLNDAHSLGREVTLWYVR